MNTTIKVKHVILTLFLTITAIFFFGHAIGHQKADNVSTQLIGALNEEIQRYVVQINENRFYITSAEQELTTQRALVKSGLLEREELQKLNIKQANEISRITLKIDTLLSDISHNGQIISILNSQIANNNNKDTVSKFNVIRLPFDFNKQDKWLTLTGNFDDCGELDIAVKMAVGIDLLTGLEKKTEKPFAILKTDNPYIIPLALSSYKTDTQKTKRFGLGFIGGYGFNLTGDVKGSPFIGGGVSYDLFCW